MTTAPQSGGQIIPFTPRNQPDGELVGPVFDGELVEDGTVASRPRIKAIATRITTITALPQRQIARTAARAAWTTFGGYTSWSRRAAAAATHGHLREQVRLARLAGDASALGEWSERLQHAKDARSKRLRELPDTILGLLRTATVLLVVLFAVTLLISVAVQVSPDGLTFASWWKGIGKAAVTVGQLLSVVAHVVFWALIPLLMLAAWREGRRVAHPPLWLLPHDQRVELDAQITPAKVILALRDVGIPALRKAIEAMPDGGAGMLSSIVIAGRGREVDAALPSGVSTAEVQARRQKLAENLHRHRHELHISIPPAARTVRLWIAEPGALNEPVGPSPLVLDPKPRANYRTGEAPWGEDLRGGPRMISLYQRHLLITGLSNQGKTYAMRALALWLAFDIKPRFRIGDLKGAGDWSMFADIAEVLIEGPSDEHVIAATEMLEEAQAEMERRLSEGGEYDPLVCIVDEAQQAFMCPAVGPDKRPYGGQKSTSRYFNAARKIHNQGRAVDVLLWQGTQNPTNQNLPVLVREGAHIRGSLAVGTESQSRMALGDKAVDGGAAPHELRPGLDKGTLVVAGDGAPLESGQSSITVRTHFIDNTAATELAKRAAELRRRRGRAPLAIQDAPEWDFVADLHEAMRDEKRVRTTVVLGRLAELDPSRYESWTHADLAAMCDREGFRVHKIGGYKVIRLEDVDGALARRDDE
ncbi:MAG TPA: ATP-binding protein [Pseudonocardiaceae bacterium]